MILKLFFPYCVSRVYNFGSCTKFLQDPLIALNAICLSHFTPSSGDLVGETGPMRCIRQLGKAGLVTEKEVAIRADSCSSSFILFQEESREYGNFLKRLQHSMSVRLKNLLLLLVSYMKQYQSGYSVQIEVTFLISIFFTMFLSP